MALFDFLKNRKQPKAQTGTRVTVRDFLDTPNDVSAPGVDSALQQMAFWAIVRKIGAAVGAVEWETYRGGSRVKAREYWSWNYSPNPNQTKSEFFQMLVAQLYQYQEALIVDVNGARYVADSFGTEEALAGDIYTDVNVRGKSLSRTYRQEDVLHITFGGASMSVVLGTVANATGKLIKSATSAYTRSQGTHGILRINDTAEADADFEETYADLVDNKFSKYFSADNAVLPLFEGYDFTAQESTGGSTKSSLSGTRDIRSLYDDIVELTAQAMGVPLSIVTGKSVTKEDWTQFMTECVKPIVSMLTEEANRKLYGMQRVVNGSYIAADFKNVRHIDLFDIADPIDKLIGSGALTINDIRKRLGLEVIDEEWANQHWMTKNYSPAEELLTGVENTGGKEDETNE